MGDAGVPVAPRQLANEALAAGERVPNASASDRGYGAEAKGGGEPAGAVDRWQVGVVVGIDAGCQASTRNWTARPTRRHARRQAIAGSVMAMSWATAPGASARRTTASRKANPRTVPALVRTVPGAGEFPSAIDRDAEGGFDRRIAALGPARDVGVGVHRSRICLLGEGGQDADRVAEVDMESPAEVGDRRSRASAVRNARRRWGPAGPSSAGSITSAGTISSWASVAAAQAGLSSRRSRRNQTMAVDIDSITSGRRCADALRRMDCDDPLGVRVETIACGKVTRSSDQRRVPGRGV